MTTTTLTTVCPSRNTVDLAGEWLTEVNHAPIGPFLIEHARWGRQHGQTVLALDVWMGDAMVQITLPEWSKIITKEG